MKKAILTTILMAFCLMPLQPQILKNLQKKAEKKVEYRVTVKARDEAGKPTNNMMNSPMSGAAGYEQVDPSEIPQVYDFDWSYVLKMQTRQGDMILNYFLKKDAPYFGMKLPENDMHMVMDASRNLNVMYMRDEGHKMVMATRMPNTLPGEITADNDDEYTFRKIANKNILGYDCEGYQGENRVMVLTFYVTTAPDITFGEIYRSDKMKLPKGFDPKWIKDGKGIMMQMIMEGKKNAKDNTTITCIGLEKTDFSLNKGDYNSLAGN